MNLNKLFINEGSGIEIGDQLVIDGPLRENKPNQEYLAISHAHTDHANTSKIADAVSEHGATVYMTEPTKDLLDGDLNMQTDLTYQGVEYRKKISLPGIEMEFVDANHMLGSAQIGLNIDNLDYTVGYSGDIGPNVENTIDVDVLFLDPSHSTFFDNRQYSRADAFIELAQEVNKYVQSGESFNIIAGSGLLQLILHKLATSENIPLIWDKIPAVIGGSEDYTPKRANRLKRFCNVYKNWGYFQPEVLSKKDLKDEDRIRDLELSNQCVKIFSDIADAQNSFSYSFNCELRPNKKEPISPFSNGRGVHVSLSAHETGDTLRQYIEKVSPKLVITDGHRNNNHDKAKELSGHIKNKMGIESITSLELNERNS